MTPRSSQHGASTPPPRRFSHTRARVLVRSRRLTLVSRINRGALNHKTHIPEKTLPAEAPSGHQDERAQKYPHAARHTKHTQQKQQGGLFRRPDLPCDVPYRFYQLLAVLECRARAEHKGDVSRSRELRIHAEFCAHKDGCRQGGNNNGLLETGGSP